MTVRQSNPGEPLPLLVRKSCIAIQQEVTALKEAVEKFANDPQASCPRNTDARAWRRANHRYGAGQRRLGLLGQQQARLMFVNAYDHLVTMGRALGSDGTVSLYAHTTLSRAVCEAAVRVAWLLDSAVSYEMRLARSAAGLLASAESRVQGASAIPVKHLGAEQRQSLIAASEEVRDKAIRVIESAGFRRNMNKPGNKVASIELPVAHVKVPIKLDITSLMSELLPESPTWYAISSGVAHSATWALDSAIVSDQFESNLTLTPDVMEIAAAAETVISASALVIKTYGLYYGHNPDTRVCRSQQRRDVLDRLMVRHIAGASS